MKKLLICYLLLVHLFSCLHLPAKGTSVCVARSHFGDEFVNEDGTITSCADYGARCAAGTSLTAGEEGVQRCRCDMNGEFDANLPCPTCKCNVVYPFFNGTNCAGGRNVGWTLRDDLVQPNLNYSQVLAIGKTFSYPTKVFGWKVRIENDRTEAGWLLLQIWRPKIGGFDLVGATNFTYDPSRGLGYVNTDIPMHDGGEITVDRGDIIGLFLPSGGIRGAPFAIGYDSTRGSTANAAVSDASDMLLFDIPIDQESPTELTTVDYDEHIPQFVINILAMIGPIVEGGKECITKSTKETDSTSTPTQAGNSLLDVEYIRLIVVPILLILLFLIFLGVGIGVTVLCVRCCISSRRNKRQTEKYQQTKVVSSLDTSERSSVYNIYPPNPVLGTQRPVRCTSFPTSAPKLSSVRSTSDSIYETISDVDLQHFSRNTSDGGASLPHTYAVLERPLLLSDQERASGVLTNLQLQEQGAPDKQCKLEVRLSTKDKLTGQANEQMEASSERVSDCHKEMSTTCTEEGVDDGMEDDVFQIGEVDSDHDLTIYQV